jgi:phospholipase D1/2
MAQRIDESNSPKVTSSESPVQSNSNGSAALRPSSLRAEVKSEESLKPFQTLPPLRTTNGSAHQPPIEAVDYLNGGIPHESPVADGLFGASAISQRHSALKHTGSFPREGSPLAGPSGTPPGRRSVQFARAEPGLEYQGHTREDSWGEDGETPGRDRRGPSLMSKLKALASSGGLQQYSAKDSQSAKTRGGGPVSAPLSASAVGAA